MDRFIDWLQNTLSRTPKQDSSGPVVTEMAISQSTEKGTEFELKGMIPAAYLNPSLFFNLGQPTYTAGLFTQPQIKGEEILANHIHPLAHSIGGVSIGPYGEMSYVSPYGEMSYVSSSDTTNPHKTYGDLIQGSLNTLGIPAAWHDAHMQCLIQTVNLALKNLPWVNPLFDVSLILGNGLGVEIRLAPNRAIRIDLDLKDPEWMTAWFRGGDTLSAAEAPDEQYPIQSPINDIASIIETLVQSFSLVVEQLNDIAGMFLPKQLGDEGLNGFASVPDEMASFWNPGTQIWINPNRTALFSEEGGWIFPYNGSESIADMETTASIIEDSDWTGRFQPRIPTSIPPRRKVA